MGRLLFVCTGNVCRSPYAERLADHRARKRALAGWEFASAGVAALAGSPMYPPMAQELIRRGGDPAGFVARQVDRGTVMAADLILVMEKAQRERLVSEYPQLVRRVHTLGQLADLTRPWGADVRGRRFLDATRELRTATHSRFDVGDPYQRGAQKAAEVAALLDELVTSLVRRLGPEAAPAAEPAG